LGTDGFAIADLIGVTGVSGDDGGRWDRFRGGVVGNVKIEGDNFSDIEDEVDAADTCPLRRRDKSTDSSKLGRSDEMRSKDIRSDGFSDCGDDELMDQTRVFSVGEPANLRSCSRVLRRLPGRGVPADERSSLSVPESLPRALASRSLRAIFRLTPGRIVLESETAPFARSPGALPSLRR
jgi:hypothetical protein